MLKQPSILVGIAVGGIAATLAVAALAHSTSTAIAHGQGSGQVVQVHSDLSVVSGFGGLNPDQRLDKSLALPGMKGVLLGNIGAAESVQPVTDPARPEHQALVTDHTFTIERYFGHQPAPYSVGTTITLRVPGGFLNNVTEVVDDAPSITPGEAFVFVRDQGSIAGGNTATVIVAASTADVFEVSSGAVLGQGYFSHFSEPVAAFIGHFSRT